MKFSVIIPVYNAEKYIEECVSSVFNQTCKDFEIVLVDDGSTDKSAGICDDLVIKHGQRIKVIHQENQGQLLSRCEGAEKAQGEYCVYLDADDLLYENCFEVLSEKINDFSEPDIIVYNYDNLNTAGQRNKCSMPVAYNEVFKGDSKKTLYELLYETPKFNTMWNKCIKRRCLIGCRDKFLKYSSLRSAEDRLQVMEVITGAETVVCIEESLYCYRLFEGSITRNFNVSQVDKFNMKQLCEAEEQYLEIWGMKTFEWQRKLEANFLNNATYTFLKFYENIKDKKKRAELVSYNWLDFVPESYIENVFENPNVSEFNKQLWRYIINHNYLKIKMLFTKQTAYKKIRHIKRKIVK